MTNSAAASGTTKMVTGLFPDSQSIERAYEIVSARGYGTSDINVVMSDDTRRRYFSDDRQVNTMNWVAKWKRAAKWAGLSGEKLAPLSLP